MKRKTKNAAPATSLLTRHSVFSTHHTFHSTPQASPPHFTPYKALCFCCPHLSFTTRRVPHAALRFPLPTRRFTSTPLSVTNEVSEGETAAFLRKSQGFLGDCASRQVSFVFVGTYHILGDCASHHVSFGFRSAHHISMCFYVFRHFGTICCRKMAHDSDIFWRKHIDIYHYIW